MNSSILAQLRHAITATCPASMVACGLEREPILDLAVPDGPPLYQECLFRVRVSEEIVLRANSILPALRGRGDLALIDQVVVQLALGQLRQMPDLVLGCNLSLETLREEEHWHRLLKCIERKGDVAQRLVLEVSESCPLHMMPGVATKLRTLQGLGCRLALDDFGIGYALPHFIAELGLRWDMIKVDRSQLRATDRPGARDGLREAIGAAREFSAIIIGEGIETDADLQRAREAGASHGQGYLWRSRFQLVWPERSSASGRQIITALTQSGLIPGQAGIGWLPHRLFASFRDPPTTRSTDHAGGRSPPGGLRRLLSHRERPRGS